MERLSQLGRAGMVALLAVGLSVGVGIPTGAQPSNPLGMPLASAIGRIYTMLTGGSPPTDQGLRGQIDHAAQIVYGAQWAARLPDGLVNRVAALHQVVRPGNPNVSLMSRSLALEWSLNQALYEHHLITSGGELTLPAPTQMPLRPLVERVAWLETILYGQPQTGGLTDRLERLAQDIWGGGGQRVQLRTRAVTVQPGAGSVRVRLLGTISNERNQLTQPGTVVPVLALEDLRVGDALVVPRGMVGFVRVEEAEPPGPLGRPGRLSASGQIWAVDGTWLGIRLGLAPGQSREAAAAGATVGGAVVAGPLGVAAGLLVEGEARTLRAGDVVLANVGPLPGFTQQPVPEALVP